jgi:hypothetical protein
VRRPGPEMIGTDGASDGDALVYNAATDEYEPGAGGGGGGITGLTSADATVDITDNGDGTLDLSAPGSGGGGPKTATFKANRTLTAATGTTRLYNDTGAAWTLQSIRATVETAPSGGSVVVDVNKNGTTVFTTQANRPTITTGNLTSGKVTAINVTAVADGDYLTVDVDTATSPSANLTVTIVLQ